MLRRDRSRASVDWIVSRRGAAEYDCVFQSRASGRRRRLGSRRPRNCARTQRCAGSLPVAPIDARQRPTLRREFIVRLFRLDIESLLRPLLWTMTALD